MTIYKFIKAWTIGVIIGSSISLLLGLWNIFSIIWLIGWVTIWCIAKIIKERTYFKNFLKGDNELNT